MGSRIAAWQAFLGCLAFLLMTFIPDCEAHNEALQQSNEYNYGVLGPYVTNSFVSTDVTAPKLNFMKPFTACDDGSYIFLAPRGETANSSVCILDATGSLIWTTHQYHGQAYNLQAQTYKGEQYLTFWAGDNSVGGHGVGQYYMLDKHYHIYRSIIAANDLPTDLHAFTITADDTALLSVYKVTQVDLSTVPAYIEPSNHPAPAQPARVPPPLGPPDGWIWESMFQEIDIETGELLFEWRASEHFEYTASYDPMKSATEEESWDWFHINSVEKDNRGNYLISARHLRTIAYIDGKTGDVLWQLGGRSNSFADLSFGMATKFIGQHDAHWVPNSNYTSLSFFDNRADWSYHTEKRSYGIRIDLDLDAMTAKVGQRFLHDPNVYSVSQGSYQTLPNGNVLIGYGNNGVVTEYSPDGTVLCDAYFEPSKRWTSGDVQSYRNLKFNWTGMPTTQPKVAIQDGIFYISWLGSTETTEWLIQHSSLDNETFHELVQVRRDGFETAVDLTAGMLVRQYVQATALDARGRPLAISDAIDIGYVATVPSDEPLDMTLPDSPYDDLEDDEEADGTEEMDDTFEDLQVLLMWMVLALGSSLLALWACRGLRKRRTVVIDNEYVSKRDDDLPYREQLRQVWSDPWALWARMMGRRSTPYRRLVHDARSEGGRSSEGDYALR
ncbi:hypothetical protein LTR78_010220 [Recurvomyces mirabilis]|uniref:ASST-domain-containing protein n=1 Tax=Recurvomyces mirabilis TaxID=574656 RepID=A0AAE0WGA3_9PEZI|nr:hypothetical protein LTR78_010220 [Recurvomyces mirabilis]KAK5149686.1 hypothetical protein LTS14_010747 [Recurvomyces mirabilis]